MCENSQWQNDEVVILIKAAPIATSRGETVCCAGIDINGNWRRLYPIAFRQLKSHQKFKRWDRISYRWRRPRDDSRIESQRVDHESINIEAVLKKTERERFLGRAVVTGLEQEHTAGRSLALLQPKVLSFTIEPRPQSLLEEEAQRFAALRNQGDLFANDGIAPYSPCPFDFKYTYEIDDGKRTGTCQDWETETTFFKWRNAYGEEKTLVEMRRKFGEELPQKGLMFAMGTHSKYPVWLINGLIQLDIKQASLF